MMRQRNTGGGSGSEVYQQYSHGGYSGGSHDANSGYGSYGHGGGATSYGGAASYPPGQLLTPLKKVGGRVGSGGGKSSLLLLSLALLTIILGGVSFALFRSKSALQRDYDEMVRRMRGLEGRVSHSRINERRAEQKLNECWDEVGKERRRHEEVKANCGK